MLAWDTLMAMDRLIEAMPSNVCACVDGCSGYLWLHVSRTKTKMGDRAFEVAGSRTWNSLPATIRETKTLPALKNS